MAAEPFDRNDPYMQHVLDLEEWNEDAGFVWGIPTVVRGVLDSSTGEYDQNLVVVVHPHSLPKWDNPNGEYVVVGRVYGTTIAVYQRDGTQVALWVMDGDASGNHVDHNYWTTPAERQAFTEKTTVFRGVEAAVGETIWDEKTDRVWTCTKVIER